MSALFTPIELGTLKLPNRIVVAPMCQYSSQDGNANSWHLMHLGQLAFSGAGMLITEATAVEADGRISAQDLGLWSDANEAALAATLVEVRRHSAMPIAVQLAHAGRKASTLAPWLGGQLRPSGDGGWRSWAPSPVPFTPGNEAPLALDAAGLARIRKAFAAAAARAARAGFDAVELHAAHGYLLHQFLSPLSNQREDAYGGSLENRMRFPLEVFEAVRTAFPAARPVGARVSATDWVAGGWDLEQTTVFAAALKARGCDFLDVSSGGLSLQQAIPLSAGYQVPFANHLKKEVGMPTIAVGLITEAQHAEAIVASGQADMVALARGILYDPRWPWHAAAELGAQVAAPPQYWRCQPREVKALFSPAA
ncbi:NADH:flavin oxidoreductase/NADH oxidase [Janthinobacterium sp. 17J80-10]|uniref:NADH:flavin oxidoreductase/NADH oxidase n=1 Tax=Janthinobacterium sp. 17J80-10 TaxID=2497863 RepID=UPI0010058BA0|nr:NADH:flavin oxidoreductase/NADH oxidase [Janthinobacterium sp. 17J80-10]QAU32935.1 NADH:flavin oxidoreductase/NADH oxidase [Janthinobacterium sp. 17J80-10]